MDETDIILKQISRRIREENRNFSIGRSGANTVFIKYKPFWPRLEYSLGDLDEWALHFLSKYSIFARNVEKGIEYIFNINSSESESLKAIHESEYAIQYIRYPTEEMIRLHKLRWKL